MVSNGQNLVNVVKECPPKWWQKLTPLIILMCPASFQLLITPGPKQYADIFEYFQAKKNATSLWLHICTNGLQIQVKRHFNSIGVAFT